MNFQLPDDMPDEAKERACALYEQLVARTEELCTGVLDNPVLKESIFERLRDCPPNFVTVLIRSTSDHGETLYVDAYYVKQK